MVKHTTKNHEDYTSHISHVIQTSQSRRPKISNAVLGIVAILAIFLIVLFAFKNVQRNNQEILSRTSDNTVGQASAVLAGAASDVQSSDTQDTPLCQILVGQTTVYDATTLSASLPVGVPAYYADNTVDIQDINSNGCVVEIGGDAEFLAVGQLQKVGTLYVTVKQVVLS
jgi:hypothetical protein